MPDDAPTTVTHYRSAGGSREPLAAPGEGGDHVHYQPSRQHGIGVLTSRRPATLFRPSPTGPTGPT